MGGGAARGGGSGPGGAGGGGGRAGAALAAASVLLVAAAAGALALGSAEAFAAAAACLGAALAAGAARRRRRMGAGPGGRRRGRRRGRPAGRGGGGGAGGGGAPPAAAAARAGRAAPPRLVAGVMSRRPTRLNALGRAVMAAPLLSALFAHEAARVARLAPRTGAPLDEQYFVIRTAAAAAAALAAGLAAAAAAALAGALPPAEAAAAAAAALLAPVLAPLLAPLALSARASARASATSSELLAFLTLAGIVHTVDRTLFWTFESIASAPGALSAMGADAAALLRHARAGGMDEVSALMELARFHPHAGLRTFLQRYASLVGTSPARLAMCVEQARDEALSAAVAAASSYAAAAGGAFFAGTMAVAVLPMMLVGVMFLPGAGAAAAAGPLLAAVMAAPLAFLALPAFMPADSFLRDAGAVRRPAAQAAAAAAAGLAAAGLSGWGAESLPLAAAAAAAALGGAGWALSARADRDAAEADAEMPALLDYIAEQRRSRPDIVGMLAEYAALPSTGPCVAALLRGVASAAVVRPAREAFCGAARYPSAAARFALFVLYAIHEHGGGTRETVVAMAHSMRRMSEARRRFAAEVRLPALLVVASPAVLAFAVMSASLMAAGPAAVAGAGAGAGAAAAGAFGAGGIAAAAGLADSLRPAVAMTGVCGGLAACRIADHSFRRTRYLAMASSVAAACLAGWDAAMGLARSLL